MRLDDSLIYRSKTLSKVGPRAEGAVTYLSLLHWNTYYGSTTIYKFVFLLVRRSTLNLTDINVDRSHCMVEKLSYSCSKKWCDSA